MREGTKATTSQAQSHIIKRPRLTKLLDDSGAKLILLVAPAGYGKTNLAREWTAAYRRPLAWYQATTASADVAALATGLAVELDAAVDDGQTTSLDRMAALASFQQRPDVLARALARSRHWPRSLTIVIDDYHHLAAAKAAAEFIEQVTALVPATFLVVSRARPAWVAPRQAVYGELLEIGVDDLAMTQAEAQDVLATSSAQTLRPRAFEISRGWPVVIGLAARAGRTEFPRTLPRHLYTYLADDLLQATASTTQNALTLIAVCGTNDRGLAHELIGPKVGDALSEAVARGLLTLEGSDRLVLHPLLSEYLIERLHETGRAVASEVIRPLIRQLRETRRWAECLSVAEALPEVCDAYAASVLEDSLEDLLTSGRVETVRRWIALARQIGLTDPIIDLAEAEIAYRDGDYESAMTLGERAATLFGSGELQSRAQLVAGRAGQLGDRRDAAMDWLRAAQASARTDRTRTRAMWGELMALNDGESGDLHVLLERFAGADDGTVDYTLQLAIGRTSLGFATGAIDAGLMDLKSAAGLRARCSDPLIALSVINQYAWALLYAARYQDALSAADELIADADGAGLDFAIGHGLLAKGRALVGVRRFADAQDVFRRVANRVRTYPDEWTSAELALSLARLQIGLGNLDRARDSLAAEPSVRLTACQRAEHYGHRALIEAASGRPDEATGLIAQSPQSRRIEARAVVAMVSLNVEHQLGRADENCVDSTFGVVLRSGCHDAIVNTCRASPGVARQIATSGEHATGLGSILQRSSDEPIAKSVGLHIPKTLWRAEKLSPRETEVYELMIQGRTNQQIAQSLFITESTAKVHVRHIFEKLGVRSRVEAVRALPEADERL